MLLSWLTYSKHDLSCIANRCAQLCKKIFTVAKIRELKEAVKWAQGKEIQSLKYSSLKIKSEHFGVYTDTTFAPIDYLSTQLLHLILFLDGHKNCHIIDFQSRKIKQIVRFVMGEETYAFLDGFDASYVIRGDTDKLLTRTLEK